MGGGARRPRRLGPAGRPGWLPPARSTGIRVRYWQRRLGDRAWRRLEPGLWNYERAFGPVIDELAPDLIHAHDFRMLGVGARAGRAAAGP